MIIVQMKIISKMNNSQMVCFNSYLLDQYEIIDNLIDIVGIT